MATAVGLHVTRLGQQQTGVADATRAVNKLVTCTRRVLLGCSTIKLNRLQPVTPQTCARYLDRVSLGQ